MEKGLQILETIEPTAIQRPMHANTGFKSGFDNILDNHFPLPRHRWSRLNRDEDDEEDDFNDSAIGSEVQLSVNSNAVEPKIDDK